MNLLHLSLNLLRRDWRPGEWRVLLIALILAARINGVVLDRLFNPQPAKGAIYIAPNETSGAMRFAY
jgi:hypothetical protein